MINIFNSTAESINGKCNEWSIFPTNHLSDCHLFLSVKDITFLDIFQYI